MQWYITYHMQFKKSLEHEEHIYVENTKARMSPYLLSVFPHFCIMVSKDIARRATSKTRFVTIGWESRYKSC